MPKDPKCICGHKMWEHDLVECPNCGVAFGPCDYSDGEGGYCECEEFEESKHQRKKVSKKRRTV